MVMKKLTEEANRLVDTANLKDQLKKKTQDDRTALHAQFFRHPQYFF